MNTTTAAELLDRPPFSDKSSHALVIASNNTMCHDVCGICRGHCRPPSPYAIFCEGAPVCDGCAERVEPHLLAMLLRYYEEGGGI